MISSTSLQPHAKSSQRFSSGMSYLNRFLVLFSRQCGAGLQAAGGQAAAVDEAPVSHRGVPPPGSALHPGHGLLLHPQAQVQTRVQEARALETLVPLTVRGPTTQRPTPLSATLPDLCICVSSIF